jgi:hypothetical protein
VVEIHILFLWGNSQHSLKIFRMQKKIIRIMTGCSNRASSGNLFRKLKIFPLASQSIFSLMLFVVNNNNLFVLNSDKHNVSVRHANNLYQPSSNFTVYQKGVFCIGIKVYVIIIFLPTLRMNLIILGNLKLISCIFSMHIIFIL